MPSGKLYYGAQFSRIAEAVGFFAATLLCKQFGGIDDFYVPIQAEADHHLKNIIGNKHFQKLSAAFGGKRIGIPFPPRLPPKKVAVIDAVLDTPATSKEIARRCNVSQRYVRSIRAELRECGLLKACVGGASEYGFIGQTRPKALPGDAG